MTKTDPIIAIDVGNTRIKISDGSTRMSLQAASVQSPELRRFFTHRPHHTIAVSSVNAALLQVLRTVIGDRTMVDVGELIHQSKGPLKRIRSTGTGHDRILGCIAALNMADPPLITIDFGTATTVNVVNAQREFMGGYILPGLHTQAESLQHNTAALPRISFENAVKRSTTVPTSTDDAIREGIVMGTAGAVRLLTQSICTSLRRETVSVFVTGGNLEYVLPTLRKHLRVRVVDDLVLRGISDLVRHYRL